MFSYVCNLYFVSHSNANIHVRIKKSKTHLKTRPETGRATEIVATKACWTTHKHTHTTHQGSAGRWEEHRGERDGRFLARPLSPHHPASPSQQERALNQRSKREEGSEGREERRREGRKRQMQNELMRGSRGSRVLKRSHEMNKAFNVFVTCVSVCILLIYCFCQKSLKSNHNILFLESFIMCSFYTQGCV